MRTVLMLVLLLLFCPGPTAPQPVDQVSGVQYDPAEQAVHTALAQFSQGLYTSWTEKELNRLGDASCVALTKVLADKDLENADIDHVLAIISMSFAAPKIVQVEADRQPRTALFILKYFNSISVDPAIKKKIADVKVLLEGVRSQRIPH